MTPLEKDLQAALDLLGPNGEHWIQGEYGSGLPNHCMAGACIALKGNSFSNSKVMRDFLDKFIAVNTDDTCCESFNDAPGRTFSEVRGVFEKAIRKARGEK